ncbi:retrovirus-related pol polyprotein from transposon TNT 1-94 [Tanacetum coccineum]
MQLNQEIFQKESLSNTQNALEIPEYFENNDLKAQLQAKDTTICKLKEHIKSMSQNNKEEKVKYEMDEIKTINIELEHSVTKLLSKNERLHKEIEHLKKIYKDQFDSIKKTRVLSKEHGKEVGNTAQIPITTTISPGMFKLDLSLAPRLLKNREAHIYYLKHTQEQADILRGIVQQAKVKQPLDNALDLACQERLKCSTSSCRSQPTCNKNNDKIWQKPSSNRKNKVEAQPRKVNKKNRAKEPICDDNVKHTMLNANSQLICVKCKQCMFDANHDVCFLDFVNDVNMRAKSTSKSRKTKCIIFGNLQVIQIVLWYLDSGCSKYMTGNRSPLMNFVSKFLGTVRFRNDQVAKIMGYGDYQLGNFYDAGLEVAFWKNTCFIRNLEGVDLLSGSRDTNFYTISLDDMLKTSPIYLLSKASKTKSWLWHRRLSHLNFGTLNKLAKDGLARGISKLKFQKDHLCSACALGKSKKSSHQPKAEDTNQEKLYLLHMDICGPMRVESINGKKYILVIVDDYLRFTWVRFLRSKDKAPDAIIELFVISMKMLAFRIKLLLLALLNRMALSNGETELLWKLLAQCFEESPKTPHFHDDPFHESLYEDSTSHGSSSNMRPSHTPFKHLGRWTKDHPIANMIGDPSRSVSTRKQLETDAMWCYFDAFLTSVEPKNFKHAMTKPSWIDEMQKEIHEFKRLQVWELVPCPNKVMLIKLKCIYKVKTDEFGGVLKNKARLVAQGFRQEGIDFEK